MDAVVSFKSLYGRPSNGKKTKKWTISVEPKDDFWIIKRVYGYVGFKETESIKEIKKGKNIGKKNETSARDQAISEAEAMWTKQKEQGYTEDTETTNDATFLPMLAHNYAKRQSDIKVPFYTQPKLDGVRVTITGISGGSGGQLLSRTGKPYVGFDHITEAVRKLGLKKGIILDGELFTFDLDFETICSVCRKSKVIDPNQKLFKFYIFDMYDTNMKELTFEQRHNFLKGLKLQDPLVLVQTTLVHSKDEIQEIHEDYLKEKYEGVILRNTFGVYKNNYRSVDLQKYKTFIDDEYKIVDFSEAQGNDKGTIVFICKDHKSNLRFSVRPKGSREKRKEWFDNFDKVKGKMLTVRYQNLTEYGVPRFPVGVCIRDYE